MCVCVCVCVCAAVYTFADINNYCLCVHVCVFHFQIILTDSASNIITGHKMPQSHILYLLLFGFF